MMKFKRVTPRWIKVRETNPRNGEESRRYFIHNGTRQYLDDVVSVDNPYWGIGREGIPSYIKGTLSVYPYFYYVELEEIEMEWKVRLYIGVDIPEPKCSEYSLVNYFDVWGNAKEGWEVNNLCVEYNDLKIADDATEKEILEYLVDSGFLATSDRRKVRIDMNDDSMMEIYAVKGLMPLGRLQMNV